MSDKFPLYDLYTKKLSKRDLSKKQKDDFVSKVKELDQKGKELLFMLIKVYHIETTSTNDYYLPYNGKENRKNISFDLEEFPKELKQLLYRFVKDHLKTMKNDKKEDKIRKQIVQKTVRKK